MQDSDDTKRYIEYFQQAMLAPGTERRFDHAFTREWLASSRVVRAEMAKRVAPKDYDQLLAEFEGAAAAFVPKTRYDTFSANMIFSSIVTLVNDASAELGIRLKRPVVLAASTTLAATPMAMPSQDQHLLFAGEGTFAFCNYWAKMWSELYGSLAQAHGTARMDGNKVKETLLSNPKLLALPTTMALYYASTGTMVGYGPLVRWGPLRMELLQAMEVFVIAHEYGHFILEEGLGGVGQIPDELRQFEEEHFADAVGYLLSRAYGNLHKNWSAFSGAAVVLFFRSVELCELVRDQVLAPAVSRCTDSDSHPPIAERLQRTCGLAQRHTAQEERERVSGYLLETMQICDAVEKLVLASVDALQRETTS
jgi:hypothetical protein